MNHVRCVFIFLTSVSLVSCGGGGGGGSGSVGGGSVSAPAPTVSISSSVSSVAAGQTFELSWSSSNATSCSASGSWSGSKELTGNAELSESNPGNNTYTITCTGAGGSRNASVTVEITQPIITVDENDLTYRVPDGGDLLVYNFEVTAREYSSLGLIAEDEDSGTFDLEYFMTSLPTFLADAWSEFQVRRETQSFSGGALNSIQSRNRAYSSRVRNVSSDEGFHVSYIDETSYYGSTYLPPLQAGTSFTERWEFRYDGDEQRKFGTSTFSISSVELLETELGPVEAFRVTIEDASETRSKSFISNEYTGIDEVEEQELVVWIHPKIGVLKARGTAKVDDTPYSEDSYIEGEILYEIRSSNVPLPN